MRAWLEGYKDYMTLDYSFRVTEQIDENAVISPSELKSSSITFSFKSDINDLSVLKTELAQLLNIDERFIVLEYTSESSLQSVLVTILPDLYNPISPDKLVLSLREEETVGTYIVTDIIVEQEIFTQYEMDVELQFLDCNIDILQFQDINSMQYELYEQVKYNNVEIIDNRYISLIQNQEMILIQYQ